MSIQVDQIVLRFVRIPLRFEFQNRWQRIREWTKLIIELRSDDVVAFGECQAMETPFYSYETIDTAWWAITRWLAEPFLKEKFEHPRDVSRLFEFMSGHHEAKGALECAFWELYARKQGIPLYELFDGKRRPVMAGATVGVKENVDAVVAAVVPIAAAGYGRVKIKIKPGWDREVLAAVRSSFSGITLLADANAAYSRSDTEWLAGLDRLAPIIIEQPFPPAAWDEFACLQARTSAPVCLDESITCVGDVEHMIHLKAARMVNLKIGRVGSMAEAIDIHDTCRDAGVPVFIGSKIETGIGRWFNIAAATMENVTYPSDISASERYFVDEIVRDPVTLVSPGCVEPLDGPGFGTEVITDKLESHTIRTQAIPA